MELRLLPPCRFVTARIASEIADRLSTERYTDIVADIAEQLLVIMPGRRSVRDHVHDLRAVYGEERYRIWLETWIRSCCPSPDRDMPSTEMYATGSFGSFVEFVAACWLGYEIGKEIRDETNFDEWWYEWSGNLDDAFFEWVYEMEYDVYYDESGAPSCIPQ